MTKCKTKIFYCECDNPACNVTVYEYEDFDTTDSKTITIPIYTSVKYPIEDVFSNVFMKYLIPFSWLEDSWINNLVFNLDRIFNYIFNVFIYPFKFIYSLIYYFTNPIKAEANIVLLDKNKKKLNKILKKYNLDIDNKYIIKKKSLPLARKIEYILFGEMEMNIEIDIHCDNIYTYYR